MKQEKIIELLIELSLDILDICTDEENKFYFSNRLSFLIEKLKEAKQ
ncbi:MAG: hypothetical protein KKA81_17530 [Bacteroidetes bacterium]|nr:hypothetical protein [Bacteroidota bacterium]